MKKVKRVDTRVIIEQSGIIPIYKKSGMTSLDVSRAFKRVYKFKKIGHLGTLDPMAEGVLPIMVNEGTKLANLLDENKKHYTTVMKFGIFTDTDDITGDVIESLENFNITKEQFLSVLKKFTGDIEQIPPKYSAVKIDGQRAYKLSREGKEFTIPAKKVTIFSLSLKRFSLPYAEFEIECSKGTYIRSIIRDIGKELNVPATMSKLVRKYASGISIDDCNYIEEVVEDINKFLIPLDSVLKFPIVVLKAPEYKLMSNGQIPNKIKISNSGYTQLTYQNKLVAIVYIDKENKRRIYKVFN